MGAKSSPRRPVAASVIVLLLVTTSEPAASCSSALLLWCFVPSTVSPNLNWVLALALTLPSVRHMVVSLKGVLTNLDALPARMRIVAAVNEDLVARSTSSLPPRVVPKRQRVATSDLWYSSLEFVQIN